MLVVVKKQKKGGRVESDSKQVGDYSIIVRGYQCVVWLNYRWKDTSRFIGSVVAVFGLLSSGEVLNKCWNILFDDVINNEVCCCSCCCCWSIWLGGCCFRGNTCRWFSRRYIGSISHWKKAIFVVSNKRERKGVWHPCKWVYCHIYTGTGILKTWLLTRANPEVVFRCGSATWMRDHHLFNTNGSFCCMQ